MKLYLVNKVLYNICYPTSVSSNFIQKYILVILHVGKYYITVGNNFQISIFRSRLSCVIILIYGDQLILFGLSVDIHLM